jgi:hypothetical protein
MYNYLVTWITPEGLEVRTSIEAQSIAAALKLLDIKLTDCDGIKVRKLIRSVEK